MDYRIQQVKASYGMGSHHDFYLILNSHDCFVAKLYSRYDAETCLVALMARGTPAKQQATPMPLPTNISGSDELGAEPLNPLETEVIL